MRFYSSGSTRSSLHLPSLSPSATSRSDATYVIPPSDPFREVVEVEAANASVWSWLNDIIVSTASPPGMVIPFLNMVITSFSFLSLFFLSPLYILPSVLF